MKIELEIFMSKSANKNKYCKNFSFQILCRCCAKQSRFKKKIHLFWYVYYWSCIFIDILILNWLCICIGKKLLKTEASSIWFLLWNALSINWIRLVLKGNIYNKARFDEWYLQINKRWSVCCSQISNHQLIFIIEKVF